MQSLIETILTFQDIRLGADPAEKDGGRSHGFGSLWEYQVRGMFPFPDLSTWLICRTIAIPPITSKGARRGAVK